MNNRKYYIMAVVGLIAIVAVSIVIVKQNSSQEDMNEENIDFSRLYPEKQEQNEDFELSDIGLDNFSIEDDIIQMPSQSAEVKGAVDSTDNVHEGSAHENQIAVLPDDKTDSEENKIAATEKEQNADTDGQIEAAETNDINQKTAGIPEDKADEEHKTEETVPVGGNSVESTEESNSLEADVAALTFDIEAGLVWPVSGNVIMNYSPDHLIYHATLNQFRTNPAIVIACKEGTEVAAAASGIVTDISESNVTGVTITTDIGDGYKLIYGQLGETEFELGDKVEKGEYIGVIDKVSNFYSKEGSNLYFKVINNESTVDPMQLLTDISNSEEATEH